MPKSVGQQTASHDNWSLVRKPRNWARLRKPLRWVLLLGVGSGLAAYLLTSSQDEPAAPGAPGLAQGREEPGDIAGVQTFDVEAREHTSEPVDYPEHPPVGGPHTNEWMNCGIYSEEEGVVVESAVHNMEHGAVWITHRPGLSDAELERLYALYERGSYLVISPVEDLGAPIVASAWGKQLGVREVDDPRLEEFLVAYERGPQTPGHGGPCTGGIGERVTDDA